MQCHRAFISQTGPFLCFRTHVNKQMKKEKKQNSSYLQVFWQGPLPFQKIAATGGSDCAVCLVSPFQRKSEREELLRKAEPRAVHTTVFHNKVAGKKQLFNT